MGPKIGPLEFKLYHSCNLCKFNVQSEMIAHSDSPWLRTRMLLLRTRACNTEQLGDERERGSLLANYFVLGRSVLRRTSVGGADDSRDFCVKCLESEHCFDWP